MKKYFLFALSLLAYLPSHAEVVLPHVFSDHMVLQRNTDVAIWGKAEAGADVNITASWSGLTVTAKAGEDGRWKTVLPTPDAGGPYEMIFDDGTGKKTLQDILVGEVWLLCGQSNMHITIRGYMSQPTVDNLDAILNADPELPVRVMNVAKKTTLTPMEDCSGSWKRLTPDVVSATSAVGYYFALQLQASLHVPVGIMVAAQPGSTIDSWLDEETIRSKFPEWPVEHLSGGPVGNKMKQACCVFNGMIHPIAPYTVKGWIFYQGESDRGRDVPYAEMFQEYAKLMRRYWNNPEMPLYYAQIAPYGGDNPDGIDGPIIQEAQAKCQTLIPNARMITTIDVGDRWNVHPLEKRPVSQRFAAFILCKEYGFNVALPSIPTLKSVEYKDGKAIVRFDRYKTGIAPRDYPVCGFEIAGPDKVFYKAEAYIPHSGDCVEVTIPKQVQTPAALRYGFRNWPEWSLTNDWNIPVGPFRTDNW